MTPYWIRRAQLILYVLMYICFVITICIPWASPYYPEDTYKESDPFWDDDDGWSLNSRRSPRVWHDGARFKKVGVFGFYWATKWNGSALEANLGVYAFWSVFALMNSVLDYVKDRGELETHDLQLTFSPA